MAKDKKSINNHDIKRIAQKAASEAARLAYGAGSLSKGKTARGVYKDTERRLYAYFDLLEKIESDKERISELKTHGAPERSKSITRFSRSGVRLSPEEIIEALTQDLSATIAADQHEADTIAAALERIKDDPYYTVIAGRFIERRNDDEIAADISCDPSTVRRNRGRLINRLAVILYGSQAI